MPYNWDVKPTSAILKLNLERSAGLLMKTTELVNRVAFDYMTRAENRGGPRRVIVCVRTGSQTTNMLQLMTLSIMQFRMEFSTFLQKLRNTFDN
jgi:hypothetical protein